VVLDTAPHDLCFLCVFHRAQAHFHSLPLHLSAPPGFPNCRVLSKGTSRMHLSHPLSSPSLRFHAALLASSWHGSSPGGFGRVQLKGLSSPTRSWIRRPTLWGGLWSEAKNSPLGLRWLRFYGSMVWTGSGCVSASHSLPGPGFPTHRQASLGWVIHPK